ncbi:MAG TPA: cytochrome D1 domain-containing protein [Cyclobacteriaceae bacterium]|jgi:YVTN family beta-propeller protein|nr:cytochrome D1 domain-containing protein [Cyclobacteriaceae bacterium]
MNTIKILPAKLFVINFLLTIFVCTSAVAQSAKQSYLLALSKGDHTLAIVNSSTLKVIAKIPVGPDPHEVIASSDGKMAYVTNTGGGKSYEINVIDLVSQKALPNIDTRPLFGPHGITFVDDKVWFSAEGSKAVGRFDPATNKLDWSMGTGQERTHMIYVTADAKKIFTTNVNAGTVSILYDTLLPPPFPNAQPRKDWAHAVVQVSKGSEGFDVTPDGKQLWTVAADDGVISIIDLVSKKKINVIDAKALGANRLRFTPDGKLALISTLRTGDFFVYDVVTHKEVKRINLGKGGAGIEVDPDGSRAFVGCTPENYVAVIDLKKLELVGRIDVGAAPDGLAWAVR